MCTCGIDMATQQATPATHSSASSDVGRQAERPLRRQPAAPARPTPTGASGGGRRRSTSASGTMLAMQNTPMPM